MKHEILAVVRFNEGEALVLKEPIELKWNMYGTTLIGTDGVFCSCLFYEAPGFNWQAFAGRKFTIHLEDGRAIECTGQYWDGWNKTAIETFGQVIRATAQHINELKSCYVFCGYYALPEAYKMLRASYTGVVYDYWEYEMPITKNKYRRKPHQIIPLLKKLRRLQRRKTQTALTKFKNQ